MSRSLSFPQDASHHAIGRKLLCNSAGYAWGFSTGGSTHRWKAIYIYNMYIYNMYVCMYIYIDWDIDDIDISSLFQGFDVYPRTFCRSMNLPCRKGPVPQVASAQMVLANSWALKPSGAASALDAKLDIRSAWKETTLVKPLRHPKKDGAIWGPRALVR